MNRRRKIKKLSNEGKTKVFLNNIDKIFYINLEHRKDRNKEIIEQIKKIDPELKKTERISAIRHDKGEIGCGFSHIKCLENAKKNNYDCILILEDDFNFINNSNFINYNLNYIFNKIIDFDICLLSGNIYKKEKFDEIISHSINVQTTSGYLIKKQFYQILIDNFKEAVDELLKGNKKENYAIDINWKKLQNKKYKFYIFNNKLGYQRKSYSDIEGRIINYLV